MSKGRLLLGVGALAVLVGAAGLVALLTPPTPGVTSANFNRLKDGMTQQQVEVIFGKPGHFECCVTMRYWMSWEGESYVAVLDFFGEDGRGILTAGTLQDRSSGRTDAELLPVSPWAPEEQGLLSKLRRWLGW
jgi:hypothetical protein